jgi:hypothetical protein
LEVELSSEFIFHGVGAGCWGECVGDLECEAEEVFLVLFDDVLCWQCGDRDWILLVVELAGIPVVSRGGFFAWSVDK